MAHSFPDDWISAWLDGELSETESRQFEAQMAADPQLSERVDSMRRLGEELRRLPTHRLPASFASEIVAKIEAQSDSRSAPSHANASEDYHSTNHATSNHVVEEPVIARGRGQHRTRFGRRYPMIIAIGSLAAAILISVTLLPKLLTNVVYESALVTSEGAVAPGSAAVNSRASGSALEEPQSDSMVAAADAMPAPRADYNLADGIEHAAEPADFAPNAGAADSAPPLMRSADHSRAGGNVADDAQLGFGRGMRAEPQSGPQQSELRQSELRQSELRQSDSRHRDSRQLDRAEKIEVPVDPTLPAVDSALAETHRRLNAGRPDNRYQMQPAPAGPGGGRNQTAQAAEGDGDPSSFRGAQVDSEPSGIRALGGPPGASDSESMSLAGGGGSPGGSVPGNSGPGTRNPGSGGAGFGIPGVPGSNPQSATAPEPAAPAVAIASENRPADPDDVRAIDPSSSVPSSSVPSATEPSATEPSELAEASNSTTADREQALSEERLASGALELGLGGMGGGGYSLGSGLDGLGGMPGEASGEFYSGAQSEFLGATWIAVLPRNYLAQEPQVLSAARGDSPELQSLGLEPEGANSQESLGDNAYQNGPEVSAYSIYRIDRFAAVERLGIVDPSTSDENAGDPSSSEFDKELAEADGNPEDFWKRFEVIEIVDTPERIGELLTWIDQQPSTDAYRIAVTRQLIRDDLPMEDDKPDGEWTDEGSDESERPENAELEGRELSESEDSIDDQPLGEFQANDTQVTQSDDAQSDDAQGLSNDADPTMGASTLEPETADSNFRQLMSWDVEGMDLDESTFMGRRLSAEESNWIGYFVLPSEKALFFGHDEIESLHRESAQAEVDGVVELDDDARGEGSGVEGSGVNQRWYFDANAVPRFVLTDRASRLSRMRQTQTQAPPAQPDSGSTPDGSEPAEAESETAVEEAQENVPSHEASTDAFGDDALVDHRWSRLLILVPRQPQ